MNILHDRDRASGDKTCGEDVYYDMYNKIFCFVLSSMKQLFVMHALSIIYVFLYWTI